MVKIHIQTSRLGTQQNFVQYKNRATQHTDTLITRQILSIPSQKSTQRQKRKTTTPHIGRSTQHKLRQNGGKCLQVRRQNISTNKNTNK